MGLLAPTRWRPLTQSRGLPCTDCSSGAAPACASRVQLLQPREKEGEVGPIQPNLSFLLLLLRAHSVQRRAKGACLFTFTASRERTPLPPQPLRLAMALTAVLMLLALARSAAGQAAAPAVRGPVTYNFDVTQFTTDGYFLNINVFNVNPQCRKVLGWTLTWSFPAGEFVWAATVSEACSCIAKTCSGRPHCSTKCGTHRAGGTTCALEYTLEIAVMDWKRLPCAARQAGRKQSMQHLIFSHLSLLFSGCLQGIRAQDPGDCSQVYPAGGGNPYA